MAVWIIGIIQLKLKNLKKRVTFLGVLRLIDCNTNLDKQYFSPKKLAMK
jgi:hypothetical protein